MRRLLDRSTDSVQILYTEGELDKTDLGQPPSRLGSITSNSIARIDVRLGNCCSVSSISVPTNCAWQLVKEQRLIQFGVGRPIQIFWQRPHVGRRCVALVFPSVGHELGTNQRGCSVTRAQRFFGNDRMLAVAVWRSFFLLSDMSSAQINGAVLLHERNGALSSRGAAAYKDGSKMLAGKPGIFYSVQGFFGDDRVLTAAMWRSFLLQQLPDMSPAQINCAVLLHMRATMASLARMDDTRLAVDRWH
ncbi:hypothetical protein niasHT_008828 [Heterodera trifolii]|uniref:Uncharacterized protein n=1 Tax=Heterodera trifolii TaxID=157864 RepID=A0ABD2LUW9_9BILA